MSNHIIGGVRKGPTRNKRKKVRQKKEFRGN
jgi:hypothetical protein